MDSMLRSAISKSKSYNGLLSQIEYDTLLKWARVYCSDGKEACKALATAKNYSYRQFRNVRRNQRDEEKYGSLGQVESRSGFWF
jgi:hypothetical protein